MSGVTDGVRTHDNRNHNPGLYQLSYGHHNCSYRGRNYPAKPRFALVIEPQRVTQTRLSNTKTGAPDRTRTCNLRLRRPLLYPVELRAQKPQWVKWSGQRDLNPRHPAPKAGALPDCAMPRVNFEFYRNQAYRTLPGCVRVELDIRNSDPIWKSLVIIAVISTAQGILD